jgi:hypothetical protein
MTDQIQRPETKLDWLKASTAERNALCAQFLPPSQTNPLRSWHLAVGEKVNGRLAVKDLAEAATWLRIATCSKRNWRRVAGLPDEQREHARVHEEVHHVRYTDTPAGAWMLMEHMHAQGWTITVDWGDVVTARATRPGERIAVAGIVKPEEAESVLWLSFNGVEVVWDAVSVWRRPSTDQRDGPQAAASEIVMKLAGYPSLRLHDWVTGIIRRELANRDTSPTALSTYRRIWERLPGPLRQQTMQAMRTWSPADYAALVEDQALLKGQSQLNQPAG